MFLFAPSIVRALTVRLLAFRLEGPHFLFEHLVNGCESLARVSEKARDGPSKNTLIYIVRRLSECESSVLHVAHDDFALQRERGKKACNRETVARQSERERGKLRFCDQ